MEMCSSAYPNGSEIFTKNVNIQSLTDDDFLDKCGIVRGQAWQRFSDSIKYENRFHTGLFNSDAFASFLPIIAKTYPKETNLFRVRISSEDRGFPESKRGPPPKKFSVAGRVNPEGIGILYLSSDCMTALNEVRANAFDFVTIGEFKAVKDISVINISGLSTSSPFLYEDELEKYAANRKVFQDISLEIAKPLRRIDSPIEYLPTQYIAEYIKSKNFNGVEYASTLREGGYNLAIFDEKLFKCIKVKTVEISKIMYETREHIQL
jgi:hypothetical protein